ncbi:MAG: ribonuclease E/G [Pseudomonadota bacterium]
MSIEDTAHKTNLEAAAEIARQLKLRDLAGLIVIDFIDMDEKRHNRSVERKLKDCLKDDRARIQVGRISHFGLLEMSRQRLRTGMLEGSTSQCPHCQGTGVIRSVESVALAVLRGIEDAAEPDGSDLIVSCAPDVAFYLLNNKRPFITDLEARYGIAIEICGSPDEQGANFSITQPQTPRIASRRPQRAAVSMDHGFGNGRADVQAVDDAEDEIDTDDTAAAEDDDKPRRKRRRRGGRRSDRDDADVAAMASSAVDADGNDEHDAASDKAEGDGERSDRRRSRRGGRGRRDANGRDDTQRSDDQRTEDVSDVIGEESETYASQASALASAGAAARRRPRLDRERRGRRDRDQANAGSDEAELEATNGAADASGESGDDDRPARRRRTRGGRGRSRAQRDATRTGTDEQPSEADGPMSASETQADGENGKAADGSALPSPANASEDAPAPAALHEETPDAVEDAPPAKRASRSRKKAEPTTAATETAPVAGAVPAASEAEQTADEAPRDHWGEPKASTPVLKRVTLNADDATGEADQVTPPKKEKRGWWQRNFG